jgi:hypothetical protein
MATASGVLRAAALAAPRRVRVASLPAAAAAVPRRTMASEPAVSDLTMKDARGADGKASSALVEKTVKVPAAAPSPSSSSSASSSSSSSSGRSGGGAWGRFTAFLTGVGVSSIVFFATVQRDIWESTAAVEGAVSALAADSREVNKGLRERVAVLEHEVATIKRDQQ